ncbi:MAG: undecaprenyldiphospho-muramoylpentapeptide beta-N-acetylglucosaminyltransferase [Candidatus Zixiibacteriota bacterium]|nr:MAG: undecaprenyldiphospho-muramoylpentapeptide beta-N-acetylglucosaminyltransferase [candidate division Zixibacteria bacterium]
MISDKNRKRILFAGGGTAGHLMPAINIAREIGALNKEIEPHFVGKKSGMESRIVKSYGFEIDEIDVIGMRRTITGIMKFAVKWLTGYGQAKNIVNNISPIAVVGTGGYISAPVVKAAHRKGIPIFLQEQNSLPGLASRTLSKYALVIFTAYESAGKYLGRAKCMLIGNPVRTDITRADRAESYKQLDLNPQMNTLLVLGGSSGAKTINSSLLNLIEGNRIPDNWQIIWQTGISDYELIESSLSPDECRIRVIAFIDDMPAAYAVSNLVISRAGAMAISEIIAAGLPSVLIPYPHATGDHQSLNAKFLEDSGAAIIIREKEIGNRFKDVINDLFNNTQKRKLMSENARRLGKPEAARRIAETILEKINEI